MRSLRTIATFGCVILGLIFLGEIPSQQAMAQRVTESFVPDRVIVRVNDGGPQKIAEIADAVGAVGTKRLFRQQIWLLNLPQGSDVRAVEASLEARDDVAYAHPDMIVHADGVPNDPSFNQQWGFHQNNDADIDAPEGWDIRTDASSLVVAVIDTGTQYNHPDLSSNIWVNSGEIPGNGLDDDNNGYVDDVHGYDFVNNDGDPNDDNGHGTHCAGTVGADTDNGVGVAGVCWDVQIMPIKFLNSGGSGSISNSILAVEYSMDNGAHLSSNSWGCYCSAGDVAGLRDAIDEAGDQGMLFVAAAGNAGADNDSFPFYPASINLPEIFSVASSQENDGRSGFSNYGNTSVDIAAPGSNIYSTWVGSSYTSISGTSMACPHVAGAVALVSAHQPALSLMDVMQLIMATVDLVPAWNGLVVSDGRLNLRSALEGGGGGGCVGDCDDPENYGTGTAGTNGVPTLTANGCPTLGNNGFSATADNFLANATGVLFVGFDRANIDGGGWTLLVDLGATPRGLTLPVVYPGGTLNIDLPIPNNPFLDGLVVDLQCIANDDAAPSGISATDGLEFVLCDG